MCQRSSAPSTRRASSRSGVISAAVLAAVSITSRSATAMASASSSAFAASTTDKVAKAASTHAGNSEPALVDIKQERVDYWISKGAQPSDTVRSRPCTAG